jgi:hypothetical protein
MYDYLMSFAEQGVISTGARHLNVPFIEDDSARMSRGMEKSLSSTRLDDGA